MLILYQRCAAIDIGKDVIAVAVRLYQPSTKPGHPIPHAWVERE